jgi:hypothetical protein
MIWWKPVGLVLLAGGILFGLDRLLLWMESKGWIYWRKSKTSASRIGNAMLEVHSFFEPSKKHLIETRIENRARAEADDRERKDSR